LEFFKDRHFGLPPFANWTQETWLSMGREADEIKECKLGWDVTDFNSGNFETIGLTLFTLRNGRHEDESPRKTYAEKIMHVREGQVTPLHFHYQKTEAIINRGGPPVGRLALQLYHSTEKGELSDAEVLVFCDGVERRIKAGELVILSPGESITLPPRLYHSFYALDADALVGEVSSLNEDSLDNHFYRTLPRFPLVQEDEPPLRLLCTEYPASH
jgi:D-lyxose ketol-isomerase